MLDTQIDLLTFGVFKTAAEFLLVSGVLLAWTGLVGKITPEQRRDVVLPFVAMFFGVFLSCMTQVAHGEPITVLGIFVGIVFGGSVTGLYAVAKDMKKTPNVVVNR